MIDLSATFSAIEAHLATNTQQSLTYAALECRLAIEVVCYQRLQIAHDYLSHDDLRRWQPKDVVTRLIQEVDQHIASGVSLSFAPAKEDGPEPTPEGYAAMDWKHLGTQTGFDPAKIGKLWNALAKVALHVQPPKSKDEEVALYGESDKIRAKVVEALAELRRIAAGTFLSTGIGREIKFTCYCGKENRRRLDLLQAGQTVSCINPDCDESFMYNPDSEEGEFKRRLVKVPCRGCGEKRDIPFRVVERLKFDQALWWDCECGERTHARWQLMAQTKPEPFEP